MICHFLYNIGATFAAIKEQTYFKIFRNIYFSHTNGFSVEFHEVFFIIQFKAVT